MADEYALPAEPEFERLFADLYPGLHDWVLQDIIEWVRYIYERVVEFFSYYWNQFTSFLTNVWNWIYERASQAILNWWYGIRDIFFWIRDKLYEVWNKVFTIASEVYQNVSQALQGIASQIISHVTSFFSQLPGMLGALGNSIWNWLISVRDAITQTVWPWIQDLGSKIGGWFNEQWEHFITWWNGFLANFHEWIGNLGPWFSDLRVRIDKVAGQVLTGLDDWAKSAWDKVTAWLEKDAHESLAALEKDSPWPTEEHGSPFLESFWRACSSALSFGSRNFISNFSLVTPESLASSPGWMENIHKWFEEIFTKPLRAITDIFEDIGHSSPRPATDIIPKIAVAGVVLFGGLTAFTIGGELVSFFKHLGLGHVSAMIYDMVNYKVLTASLVTTLALVYISTPVRYFYQEKARPYFPDLGHALSLAGEYAFVTPAKAGGGSVTLDALDGINVENKAAFKDVARYQGFSDDWLDKLYELADSPGKYFALRGMADSGFWDEGYFIMELMNSGYNVPTIKNMVAMFRRYSLGEVKGVMLPVAMTRFKEGFSGEEDLKTELRSLGLPEPKIPLYIFAANLSYQTDYASDMLTAYRTQFRKDMVTEADFRQLLAGLGINPVRIEGYVLRENASKFKPPKVTKVPTPVPEYLTDEGQLRVNTAKEAFRRSLTSAAELEAELVKLEMPPDLAEAYAQFEIIRKTPPPTE
jgi:hypothetical protein